MPRHEFKSGEILGQASHFSRMLKQWLKTKDWTYQRFIEECDGSITLSELQKYLASGEDDPGDNFRGYVREHVLRETARVSRLPVEFWSGVTYSQSPYHEWVVSRFPEYADEFWHIAGAIQATASELIGWGSSLPCSLMPLAFMREHHRVLAQRYYGSVDERDHFVETYNAKGQARHEALQMAGMDRPWVFTHIMYAEDLRAIREGEKEYGNIRDSLRRACITDLLRFVEDDRWKVQLRIVDRSGEVDATAFGFRLSKGVDSVAVMCAKGRESASLLFKRDLQGNIRWTTNTVEVEDHLSLLRDLGEKALPYPEGTRRFLAKLIKKASPR